MECSRDGDRQREKSRETESETRPENRLGSGSVWQNGTEPQGTGRLRRGRFGESRGRAMSFHTSESLQGGCSRVHTCV